MISVKKILSSGVCSRLFQLSSQISGNFCSVQEAPVLFNRVTPYFQKVTLNKPKQLNALSLDMIRLIQKEIECWNKDSDLKIVVFEGQGKGFCAGGDVKSLYEAKISGDPSKQIILDSFFREEYTADYQLANLRASQVCILDGVVMGGGVGVSINSKFRIATENSLFAMPEAKLGLITDVGASYFLSRLRDNLGLYLGLTGERLKGQELVILGLADYFVSSGDVERLVDSFVKKLGKNSTPGDIQQIISEFALKELQQSKLNLAAIKELFEAESYENLLENLHNDKKHTEFSQSVIKTLQSLCPLSVRVIFEQVKRGQNMTLKEAFETEFRLVSRFMEGEDFFEGVRCTLIDRNDKPKWKHASPLDVKQEEINRYFERLPDNRELKL